MCVFLLPNEDFYKKKTKIAHLYTLTNSCELMLCVNFFNIFLDLFGHGFTMCGCLFLHIFNQRSKFELLDSSRTLYKMNEVEAKRKLMRDGGDTEKSGRSSVSLPAGVLETHKDAKSHFIHHLSMERHVQDEIFGLLEAQCPQHIKPSFATFRPPERDDDSPAKFKPTPPTDPTSRSNSVTSSQR